MSPEPKTMSADFHVLYVDSAFDQIETIRYLLDNTAELTVVGNAADTLQRLDHRDVPDLVIINESTMGGHLLNIINARRLEQGFATILLAADLATDFNVQDKGQPTIDIFPVEFDPDILQRRVRYFVTRKAYSRQSAASQPINATMPPGKRLFDIVLSAIILLALLPLLIVVTILVRLDSRGPILYRSRRIGMGYRPFYMYKFRTMCTGADALIAGMASQNLYSKPKAPEAEASDLCERCLLSDGVCRKPLFQDGRQVCEDRYLSDQRQKATFMKFKADPRVTRLGKFLRNASIDELPQLFNILKGDMSFVGNRPLPPYEAEKLTQLDRAKRFAAPAGLTGLWQVTKRGKAGVSDQERMELDARYAETYSMKTDLVILIRTTWAVFQKENV